MQNRNQLKVSTRMMYDELLNQKIPTRIIDASSSLLEFTDTSGENHLLFSTLCDKSSAVGLAIANNKDRTALFAKRLGIVTPAAVVCKEIEIAEAFFLTHKRVVIKPINNSGGNGVCTNLSSLTALQAAFRYAKRFSSKVVIQQHVIGIDLRLLVVAGNFCSAVERRPATINGDGIHTISQLILHENDRPERTNNYMTTLSKISVENAKRYLGHGIHSIPKANQEVTVVGPANLSLGGTAHEATNKVPQAMIDDCERIARRLGLGICGVDIMWNEKDNQYYFLEVNATPGIDLHNDVFWQTKSDAVKQYVSWLTDHFAYMRRY